MDTYNYFANDLAENFADKSFAGELRGELMAQLDSCGTGILAANWSRNQHLGTLIVVQNTSHYQVFDLNDDAAGVSLGNALSVTVGRS